MRKLIRQLLQWRMPMAQGTVVAVEMIRSHQILGMFWSRANRMDWVGGMTEKPSLTPKSYPKQLQGRPCHQLRWRKLSPETCRSSGGQKFSFDVIIMKLLLNNSSRGAPGWHMQLSIWLLVSVPIMILLSGDEVLHWAPCIMFPTQWGVYFRFSPSLSLCHSPNHTVFFSFK